MSANGQKSLGPYQENRLVAEAIHVVLPSLRSTCDTVHCLDERPLLSSFVSVFWEVFCYFFLQTCQWCHIIFVTDGSSFLKIIDEQNTFPKYGGQNLACWCLHFLVTLDGFHLLLSTQLTVHLTPGWTSGSMFQPLSQMFIKNCFLLCRNSCKQCSESSTRGCFWSTVSKRCTHFEHSFRIDKSFCYLQILCYLKKLQFTISQNEFVGFSGVFRDNNRI